MICDFAKKKYFMIIKAEIRNFTVVPPPLAKGHYSDVDTVLTKSK